RFLEHAPRLAAQAARKALLNAGAALEQIDGVVVSTCTGYLCPGLTGYVAEELGLRADVNAFDLVGHGCAAALPNWQLADALLASGRCGNVLSVCVEVSSAAMYLDNDPGVLVSACLFGDGAGAAVLSVEPGARSRTIECRTIESLLNPAERAALRFEQRQGMLRNVLTRPVPRLAAEHAEQLLNRVLADEGLERSAIGTWIWHAGGRDVLLALRNRLGLSENDVRYSAAMLREFGNLSSAFVYFVLEAALADDARPGWWWMSSFGAGFSCHGALLEVA
ncbi:MAG TPA: 3-oxoacyl-[acyl-carrier-protein] synthase III C-terminal domain-containing protein, partial [Gammaproteobacteria bacterium]|nr:3-oxoacyl-[acyl-carrier-protein] synthase III C-terminal domain-containing protein [Gammaproteobacteria bacterium]